MSKTVVLAEKPSVGRDIARVLACHKQGNGYFEGNKYIVTWAFGHLVTLADPEAYGEKYKTWRLEDLPLLPDRFKLVVIKKTGKQFQLVKKLLLRPDVNQIVIATDAGREGELVARWIIEKAHVKKPVKRLWISSVTDKAIKEGFQQLRDGKQFENLYSSAVARAEADWVVGINATRALTCKHNAALSCGRVQTPTLAMIAARETEIKNFKPRTFYGIEAIAENQLNLVWQDSKTKDWRSFAKEKCDQILAKVKNQDAIVTEVKKVKKKSFAPPLYDLTELQRETNKRFGFSPKETLSVLQGLYEHHKVLTYPRTDSRYLSTDIVDTLKERIEACRVGPYAMLAGQARKHLKPGRHFVDNSKVSDHHAIIPTEEPVLLDKLSAKERKIYDLVVKRFFAVMYPPFEYEQTTIQANIGGEMFLARGKVIQSYGWKQVYGDHPEEEKAEGIKEQILPQIKEGERLKIRSLTQTSGETQPPEPFTEGSLLAAMENPVKYMSDERKDLIQTMGETGGLGTVATRADIIEKLFDSFVIEKKGKYIHITSKGKQLLELVPEELISPALTGEWEQKLGAIAKGKLDKDSFIKDMRNYAKAVVRQIKETDKTFKHDNLSTSRCPDCGKRLLEVKSKKGKMLVCQDRACGYRKGIARVTNARCPECRKKLELRGEGEGRIFVCVCGYREKYSSFQERKNKEKKGKVSRKEIDKFLKQQNRQEEQGNPALKEALAKLFPKD
ncbi:DNA topoisomerase III [Paenactinomyces guangxiensis]|uniref:DNA topoisomerase 3 n=1 Tax=Paenactinomyces guangxiensis TaxID=1490290 RepID=A0A7W1WU88_9BACL|nr:DNA topoisomerase III [Paenactinomyces guangxiensis]MBA4496170.1 DNA topoisomerase III [Paenactinomyces guangxiensis]MBH8593259.1 DNA topoisomerase III [Paenactinomyces guangxiensis]